MIGRTLGHYRVVEKIGEGGMGEVYRARDTKLNRDVALKVLPEAFSQDAERMARFQREAQVLASLNHPNIAAIYGVEEAGDVRCLVLELVEGATLADRLRLEPLPVEEALPLARQIAEALEAAHEKGTVHRDLKPSNIKVTEAGTVKLLDFGLAKALEPETAPTDPSQSPTISELATRSGVILGTAAYMSPEQARGARVDKRADVWAFGCVLYEMLTAKRTFRGDSVQDTLAAVLRAEPEWDRLPPGTPASLRKLLRRCLEKDTKRRLHDITDARLELEEILSGAGIEDEKEAPRPSALWQRAAPWLLLPLAAVAVWMLRPTEAPRTLPTVRFTVPMPEKERLAGFYRPGFALSPDGSMLAFVSGTQEEWLQLPSNRRIYIRSLDNPEARPFPGTEDAFWPVFSPDGRWLAFGLFDGSNFLIRKVEVTGGNPVTLCECSAFYGLTWGSDDTIVFAGARGGLKRVSAGGGEPETVTELDASAGEVSHRLPRFLPDGETVLFTAVPFRTSGVDWGRARIVAQSLGTGEGKLLVEGGSDARYAPTGLPRAKSRGHLVFAREGRLIAAPFDLDRLEVTGQAVPVLEGVSHAIYTGHSERESGAAYFSFSDSGVLAYVPGSVFPEVPRNVVSVDRRGGEKTIDIDPKRYLSARVSPDGDQIVLSTYYPPYDIWLFDSRRRTLRRQTFEGYQNYAVWGPGDDWITFGSQHEGARQLYAKPVDFGPGGMQRLARRADQVQFPGSWSSDGSHLVYVCSSEELRMDICISARDGEAEPFVQTRFDERYPEFSPDNRWIVYTSDESGQEQVYARPYPGPGSAVQISTEGGFAPAWSRDGREIFFLVDYKLFAVAIGREGDRLRASAPVELFEWPYGSTIPIRSYDVTPDGGFIVITALTASVGAATLDHFFPDRIHVVQNWFAELERSASTDGN